MVAEPPDLMSAPLSPRQNLNVFGSQEHLAPEVGNGNPQAFVPELSRDHGARLSVERALFVREVSSFRAAGFGRREPGQLLETPLGVCMAQAVHLAEACAYALALVEIFLAFVGLVARDQRAIAGKHPGSV